MPSAAARRSPRASEIARPGPGGGRGAGAPVAARLVAPQWLRCCGRIAVAGAAVRAVVRDDAVGAGPDRDAADGCGVPGRADLDVMPVRVRREAQLRGVGGRGVVGVVPEVLPVRCPGTSRGLWGRTGERYGYAGGMFATRQQRRFVCACNPIHRDDTRTEMTLRIADAATRAPERERRTPGRA